ncbi:MAG: plastocyanin/azurin family copper-binding protein [Haloferacaceae archaeon]
MTRDTDRRTWLKVVGGAAGVALVPALAGCSGGSGASSPSPSSATETASTSGGGGQWAERKTVDMTDSLKFDPDHVRVSKGTNVTWKNPSGIGHTVTAYDDGLPDGASYFASGGYDSEQAARDAYKDDTGGVVSKGESYSHTFRTTGTYKYFCIPHEMNGMVGYVKVV